MKLYLDTSVIIALLLNDAFSKQGEELVLGQSRVLVSGFGTAEFASFVARRVRTRAMTRDEAIGGFSTLDQWVRRRGGRIALISADMTAAETLVRRLDLALRAPDALHVAVAQRHEAALATFDEKLASAALRLGMQVVTATPGP